LDRLIGGWDQALGGRGRRGTRSPGGWWAAGSRSANGTRFSDFRGRRGTLCQRQEGRVLFRPWSRGVEWVEHDRHDSHCCIVTTNHSTTTGPSSWLLGYKVHGKNSWCRQAWLRLPPRCFLKYAEHI